MTLKSGTGQACAACKYQRRRCTPECLLAPFFPADQPKMFLNVHRLFGVKNIQNLLKDLTPDHNAMAAAMKSIKFHAAMRERYPVYGCLVEIHHLTYQIQVAEEELHAVLQHLAYYRHQHQTSTNDDYLHLGMAPPGDAINYLDFKDVNSLCHSNENNTNSTVMHPLPPPDQQQLIMPMQPQSDQDYNEMHPFFDNIEEAYESSLESPLKDSRQLVQHIDENELKSAAACFSLTSVN